MFITLSEAAQREVQEGLITSHNFQSFTSMFKFSSSWCLSGESWYMINFKSRRKIGYPSVKDSWTSEDCGGERQIYS